MRAVDIIRKKRDGHVLARAEIEPFVRGVTERTWPEYQTSALLMAIVLRGMNAEETADLTRAMVDSGQTLDLSEFPGIKALGQRIAEEFGLPWEAIAEDPTVR